MDDFQVRRVTPRRIGTEACLMLTPRSGVFLERAVLCGGDLIPSFPDELLDLMYSSFDIWAL